MPDENKNDELKEDVKNDGRNSDGNNGGSQGKPDGGKPESGGASGGSQGDEGGSRGDSRGSQGDGDGGQGTGQKDGAGVPSSGAADLLARIRANKPQGHDKSRSPKDRANRNNNKGDKRKRRGNGDGTKSDLGTQSESDSTDGRHTGTDDDGHGSPNQTPSRSEQGQGRVKDKPQGILIAGVEKFKAAPPPIKKFAWDDKPLSKKEAEDLLPKVKGMLSFLFRQIDMGITVTNKERAKAEIWSDIDDEDLDIIAGHLVDMAQASKIIATAVRRMSNSFRLVQMGLITAPKFIQTAQFYSAHGGFSLFPMPMRRTQG